MSSACVQACKLVLRNLQFFTKPYLKILFIKINQNYTQDYFNTNYTPISHQIPNRYLTDINEKCTGMEALLSASIPVHFSYLKLLYHMSQFGHSSNRRSCFWHSKKSNQIYVHHVFGSIQCSF